MKRQHWRNLYNTLESIVMTACSYPLDSVERKEYIHLVRLIVVSKDLYYALSVFEHRMYDAQPIRKQLSKLWDLWREEWDEWYRKPEHTPIRTVGTFDRPTFCKGSKLYRRFICADTCPSLYRFIETELNVHATTLRDGTIISVPGYGERRGLLRPYQEARTKWIESRDSLSILNGMQRMYSVTDAQEAHNQFRRIWVPFFIGNEHA